MYATNKVNAYKRLNRQLTILGLISRGEEFDVVMYTLTCGKINGAYEFGLITAEQWEKLLRKLKFVKDGV